MSIHNELSSDIAVALLAGKDRDPHRLEDLKQIVLRVHLALQEASKDRRLNCARAAAAGANEHANR